MKIFSSNLNSNLVRFNQAHIFLLQPEQTNFAEKVTNLTAGFNNRECRVRFAYEIFYPAALTFCNETISCEVQSLSETLEKVNATDEDNLPTEKISLSVPDDVEPQFVNVLCRQLCLLQIPFEIQTESYQKFASNPAQCLEELIKLQELCKASGFADNEINSLVTELATAAKGLEMLIKQNELAPVMIGLGDFESMNFGLSNNLPNEEISRNFGCVFVLNDENDDLIRLDECANFDKENILFLLKKDANRLNVPLHLAMTAENLKSRGFGNSCLTFVDNNNIEPTAEIIKSFCFYLKFKAMNITGFKNALNTLKNVFLKLQDKLPEFVENSSPNAEIKYLIDNEDLLFNDILPKALLYDSQKSFEQFWHEFQKKYREILDKIATSDYFGDENFLYQIYIGNIPENFVLFLNKEEFALNDTYNFMAQALRKYIKSFFVQRTGDLKKLLPANLPVPIDNHSFNEKITFGQSNIYFLGCLRQILSAEQLKTLIRHNSQMLSTNIQNSDDIIFLEVNFRKELRQLLEIEFNDKMTSLQNGLASEISDTLKESWAKISDTVHAQIESAKENSSSSVKKFVAEDERLRAELDKFVKFWNEAQLATAKLQILL